MIGYQNETALPVMGAAGCIEQLKPVYINATNLVAKDLYLLIGAENIPGAALIINARSVVPDDKNNLLQQLKTDQRLNGLPVVVISDRLHLTDSNKYIQAGADDIYDAPVFWDELWNRLSYLGKYKKAFIKSALALDTTFLEETGVTISPFKRLLDICIGFSGLIVLSPVMLLVAIAIRMESKGAVIYRSTRIGAGYKEFNFWKFRSMYADADSRLDQMNNNNQYGSDATFKKFVNDPRITRVGRLIRKYSIDELPQLYNILKGDMSVVGNRPLPVYEASQLVNYEAGARFLAPAGLTGLWQVNKRGNGIMDQKDRIAMDVKYYADDNNLWKDAKIIAKTFVAFVQKENV